MDPSELQNTIHQAWEKRDVLTSDDRHKLRPTLEAIYLLLREGKIRVSTPLDHHQWHTHAWIKEAILLSFRIFESQPIPHGATYAYDKIPLQFAAANPPHASSSWPRMIPGAVVRDGAYVSPQAILLPSFINIGAYIDAGTMVDTWATIGSCAQIGKNCHISGGTGIGGVLEPLNSNPVIIEDNCFIGARSEIAEGVIVETGAVISMGVFIGASTKIVDRATGEIFYGRVPAYSVVVPGTLPPNTGTGPHLAAAIIIKRVDEKTRQKTSLNELLRS
jgi:2,3,4,5-tetrahydropyridine-2-carboxylate N-succinyltransferase